MTNTTHQDETDEYVIVLTPSFEEQKNVVSACQSMSKTGIDEIAHPTISAHQGNSHAPHPLKLSLSP
jgi:hypothetical protein